MGFWTIRNKITFVGGAIVLAAVVLMIALNQVQSSKFGNQVSSLSERLVEADLDHIIQGVRNLVATQDTTLQLTVDQNLATGLYVLEKEGGLNQYTSHQIWQAVNQFNGETQEIDLPMLIVGTAWVGQNEDFNKTSPLVDQLAALAGGKVTLFQVMGEEGDLLRVATNVELMGNGQLAVLCRRFTRMERKTLLLLN